MRALLLVALLATNAHAIVGGTPSSDPSVVALVRGEGAAAELVCSGTVIAPHAVLVAGHCVTGELPTAIVDGQPIAPILAFTAPGFDATTLENDVAVLVFVPPLTPTPRVLATSSVAVGATVDLVGFGRTARDDRSPFAQRSGTAMVTESSASSLVTRGPAFTCEGDSGGPALIGGAIVGITSSGDCGTVSRHAGIERHRAFIESVVERTRPDSAHAGDRCWYATNCIASEGECVAALDDERLSFCTPLCIDNACPSGLVCSAARCIHAPPSPGANGSTCATDDECIDELCDAIDGDDVRVCTVRCFSDLPGFTCPASTRCEPAAGGGEACFANGSGCCSTSRGDVGSLLLALLVLGQLLRGRVTP